jgi:hypothetical protein
MSRREEVADSRFTDLVELVSGYIRGRSGDLALF